jgi:hypothetical protein
MAHGFVCLAAGWTGSAGERWLGGVDQVERVLAKAQTALADSHALSDVVGSLCSSSSVGK